MFSSSSYAGWTKVTETEDGTLYYVDYERIKKHDGYIYWWDLQDYVKPSYGLLSAKIYHQGDCKLLRYKNLSFVHHNQSMGKDTGKSSSPENPEWEYPDPNSISEDILQSVCNR
jgi:hypothetical protein